MLLCQLKPSLPCTSIDGSWPVNWALQHLQDKIAPPWWYTASFAASVSLVQCHPISSSTGREISPAEQCYFRGVSLHGPGLASAVQEHDDIHSWAQVESDLHLQQGPQTLDLLFNLLAGGKHKNACVCKTSQRAVIGHHVDYYMCHMYAVQPCGSMTC